jgi:hypothetical protein
LNDWNRYAAEFLGTFTLVFIGSLSILAAAGLDEPILVPVALGFGFVRYWIRRPLERSRHRWRSWPPSAKTTLPAR